MTELTPYILPFVLSVAVFALRPIRSWLERRAKDSAIQPQLIEKYQDSVAAFLRSSDPVEHAELRDILLWSGTIMMDDARLIRSFILFNRRLRSGEVDARTDGKAEAVFDSLNDEARHSFARALGYAFLVSSYSALFMGRIYRSMLMWMIDNDDKEVTQPKQVIYRYRKARKLPIGNERADRIKLRFER